MQTHNDPVTGDKVSFSEFATIKAQGVIRRWTVFIVFTIGTAICWAIDAPNVLLWWNLSASFFAVIVELMVGMAQFSQTRRDAAIIRSLHAIMREIHALVVELKEYGKKDLQHAKDDLAVDLDSNKMLYEIIDEIQQIRKELELE